MNYSRLILREDVCCSPIVRYLSGGICVVCGRSPGGIYRLGLVSWGEYLRCVSITCCMLEW